MTHHSTGVPAHPLCPYRFSHRPEAMVAFLETLGMTRRVSSSGDFFGVLTAGAGLVAVHGLAPDRPADTGAVHGETHLVFLAEDARHTAGRLQEDGLSSMWWDESYGRHAGLTGPHGEGIWFNEDGDHYGYREHVAEPPAAGLVVVVVRTAEDHAADIAFFSHLGYEPVSGAAAPGWTPLTVPDAPSGMIGLHAPGSDKPAPVLETPPGAHNPAGGRAAVTLGFQTAEDLGRLQERLAAAGHPVSPHPDGIAALVVEDPDGCRMEIHQI